MTQTFDYSSLHTCARMRARISAAQCYINRTGIIGHGGFQPACPSCSGCTDFLSWEDASSSAHVRKKERKHCKLCGKPLGPRARSAYCKACRAKAAERRCPVCGSVLCKTKLPGHPDGYRCVRCEREALKRKKLAEARRCEQCGAVLSESTKGVLCGTCRNKHLKEVSERRRQEKNLQKNLKKSLKNEPHAHNIAVTETINKENIDA